MDESRSHGSYSYDQSPELTDAATALTQLTKSEALTNIVKALGPEAKLHIVGGTVRDFLLGMQAGDIDLACAFEAQVTKDKLLAAGIKTVDTGLKHGTITAVVNQKNIEITSFRNPHSQRPAHTIEEDLNFRDFTINAIAFSVASCSLVDPLNGIIDLKAGHLRAAGSATARFSEDPLRIMRAMRFGPAENRSVAAEIVTACKELGQSLNSISSERVRDELKKILLSPAPAAGLRALRDWELIMHILPELAPAIGMEQNDFHIHDVFEHTLWVVDRCPKNLILRLTGLFHDIAKPNTLSIDEHGRRHFYLHEEVGTEMTRQIMQRLKFSNYEIDTVCKLVRHHMRPITCGLPGVRRIMRDLGEHFEEWRQIKLADSPPKVPPAEINQAFERFFDLVTQEKQRLKGSPYGKLAVNGQDLIDLGIKPGPAMGKILKQLEELVLDNPSLNQKEILKLKATELIAEDIPLALLIKSNKI